jgi:hypothetical protein
MATRHLVAYRFDRHTAYYQKKWRVLRSKATSLYERL